jgi:hypothetical protein
MHLAGLEAEFSHAGGSNTPREMGRMRVPVRPERYRDRDLVFLHRNPIDTAISLFFHLQGKNLVALRSRPLLHWFTRATGRFPPADLVPFLFHPGFGVEKTCRFNRMWLDRIAVHPRFLVMTYEEMRADPAAVFGRMFAHAGIEPKRPLAELVAESSFERMKEVERAGTSDGRIRGELRLDIADPANPNTAKVRSGEVRGYRKHLDEGTIARLQQICARYGFAA